MKRLRVVYKHVANCFVCLPQYIVASIVEVHFFLYRTKLEKHLIALFILKLYLLFKKHKIKLSKKRLFKILF